MPAYQRNVDDRQLATPLYATAVAATDGANTTLVTITVRDQRGRKVPCAMIVTLSDATTGIGLTATTASGAVTDKTAGTTGQILSILVAKKAWLVQTAAAGTYQLSIIDSAKSLFKVAVTLLADGLVQPVITLAAADYGS